MSFILVKTPNCPKCQQTKMLLDKMNYQIETVDGLEHPELIKKYNIMSVPVIINKETDEVISVGGMGSKKLKEILKI